MKASNQPQVSEGTAGGSQPASLAGPGAEPTSARLLVVDDDALAAEWLRAHLESLGHRVVIANGGNECLISLRARPFDLVLLDIMMPDLDGYEVLQVIKKDSELQHLSVIMISGLDEVERIARCIELGADDYLPKPFKPVLLQARIRACLEKKRLLDQKQQAYQALIESQARLAAELGEAAEYVTSLLPKPIVGEVSTEWCFIPSTQLGGDSFGYHWLDSDQLAIYLLDVCGHGVGAALLSISIVNMLRGCALPETDFGDPSQVLARLNERFPMSQHNNMYFTIWYGILDCAQRKIRFATGGHPPAVLLTGRDRARARSHELRCRGMAIGVQPDSLYENGEQAVESFGRLFLLSDGVYEIAGPDGVNWGLAKLVSCLSRAAIGGFSEIDHVLDTARSIAGPEPFKDDFSLVKFAFRDE